MGEKMEFDGAQALRHAQRVAFPRKTGTDGNARASQIIIDCLQEYGYSVKEEKFSILLPPWLWFNGAPLVSFLLLGATWLTFSETPLLASVLAFACLLWMLGWDRFWIRFGRWIVSETRRHGIHAHNVVASVPGLQGKRPLFLIAHYDSKSQSLNLFIRTVCLFLGSVSAGVFYFWILLASLQVGIGLESMRPPPWIQASFLVAVGLNMLFLFTKNGDDSEGAVDNASGVGVLLEVARLMIQRLPKKTAPVLIFTDAEELGLLGSLMFQKKHGQEMIKNRAMVINVDGVGRKGRIRASAVGKEGKRWLNHLLIIARKNGLALHRTSLPKGIMMDHVPFGSAGIPAVSLTGVWREGWHLHTRRDRLALLEEEGLKELGQLLLWVFEDLDQEKERVY